LRKSCALHAYRGVPNRQLPGSPPLYTTQGGDFGGLTRRSQEPGGVHLQGINCSNSFMGFGVASATIHCPSQGADSGGTTYPRTQDELRSTSGFTSPPEGGGVWTCHEFTMPRPVYNYVHRIMLQFYISIPHMFNYFFPISPLPRVVQSGHRRVWLRYL
jgi:hypothetical protein